MLTAAVEARAGRLTLDAELEAGGGEVVALLGANGAGKTTLLRCLSGLHRPLRGRIEVDGRIWFHGASGVDLPPHRRGVGLVPQHGVLLPHLDVAGNVAYGPRSLRRPHAEVRRRVAEAMERFSLLELASRRPDSLSGGERQRVALARAVALEPTVLLLDEPLSALDAVARAEVRAALRDLLAGRGRGCTVLVTHDARDALELARRVTVLDGGRVVQEGAAAELVQRPRSPVVAALAGGNWIAGAAVGRDGDIWTVEAGTLRLRGAADVEEPPGLGGPAYLLVDPREITLHGEPPHGSALNCVSGSVTVVGESGGHVRVTLGSEPAVTAEVTGASAAQLDVRPGRMLWASFKATAARVFG